MASSSQRRKPRAAPTLEPWNIVRSIHFVQAAIRRKLLYRRSREAGAAAISPPLACALSFVSYLLDRRKVDIEYEAMGVCALICGRESSRPKEEQKVCGLTLGFIAGAYKYYEPSLPPNHPVLLLLKERFYEVCVDVDEDIIALLKDVSLPSVARKIKEDCCRTWGAPRVPPGGGDADSMFPHVDDFIHKLSEIADGVICSQLGYVCTRASFEALTMVVERELAGKFSIARGRVEKSKKQHFVQMCNGAQSDYGWPPTGPLQPLAVRARFYANELGCWHPIVEDFAAAVVRLRKKAEDSCTAELAPLEADVIKWRNFLKVKEHPRMLAEGYQREFEQAYFLATQALEFASEQLGYESDMFVKHMRGILADEDYLSRLRLDAEKTATELRNLGPAQDPQRILDELPESAVSVESRIRYSARLARLIEALHEMGSDAGAYAHSLAHEFRVELAFVSPLSQMLRPNGLELEDDGWHKPPGFEIVDVPFVPAPPPPPPEPDPIRNPKLPELVQPIVVKMRLHGVTLEDVRCKSEILLMEQCADLVAKECGVPREWVGALKVLGGTKMLPKATSSDSEVSPSVADSPAHGQNPFAAVDL